MRKWQKRLLIFLLILAFTVINVFAGAVAEAITNIVVGSLAVIGGVVGAFFTGGATLALSAVGVGMIAGGATTLVEQDREKLEQQNQYMEAYNNAYSNYVNAQQLVNSINANISSTEADIMQTEANISSFDQTLVRWQSQYDQQLQSLQMEGESAYTQLMQNWQGVELVNATRGQTGGSAALVAQSQLDQVERLAGTDLRLDENGGTYGTYLNEFKLDMLAGRTELVGNMNIQQQALAKYQSALASYKSQLSSAQSAITAAQNQMNSAKQNYINAGGSAANVGG